MDQTFNDALKMNRDCDPSKSMIYFLNFSLSALFATYHVTSIKIDYPLTINSDHIIILKYDSKNLITKIIEFVVNRKLQF